MKIIKQTTEILNQTIDLIKSLNDEEYVAPLSVLNNTSVGQHFRHIIEFYIELINGYDNNLVCYDNRQRKTEFELNQDLIINEFKQIISSIHTFDLQRQLNIVSNHGLNENENSISQSSVLRELIYALDHTIHHLAIIKIAIQTEFKNIVLSPTLGVAPSTVRNRNKVCAQ